MPSLQLTDRYCQTAKADEQTDYFDAHTKGLALRVTPAGHKAWIFLFTSPKTSKRARMTFGTYPATGLAKARERAAKARGDVEAGKDPRDVAEQERAGAMTVRGLVESYIEKHAKVNLRTGDAVERRLNKNVLPVIGDVKVADLHRRDVNRVIDPIVGREALVEASRVFEDMRALFRWAVARGDIEHAPTEGMKKPTKPKVRERVLSDEEIRQVWFSLPKAIERSKQVQRIVRLCLVTGQRVGEVAGLERAELDLKAKLWSLPGSRTKNGHPHTVPLSDMAVDIIKDAIADGGAGRFVFPSGDASLPPHAVATTLRRAQEPTKARPKGRFGIDQWTAHDLRRTALTGMAKLGVAPIVLGHVANHRTTTKAGVTLAVYMQHTYDREKREALDLWADRLPAIIGGNAAVVVPMAKAAESRT